MQFERFEIVADDHNYIVNETIETTKRDGTTGTKIRSVYYPRLDQALQYILEQYPKAFLTDAETLVGAIKRVEHFIKQIDR